MELAVGIVLEGKVTGLTKFGAFVSFEGGRSGLVHISEVANAYVSDVNDYVKVGQTVKVKVIGIGEGGKINLSIKRAEENPRPDNGMRRNEAPARTAPARRDRPAYTAAPETQRNSGKEDFEDRLKKFMQESDSRIADNRMYSERRQRNRRR